MKAKLILAFAAGAVLASGIVYVAMRPASRATPAAVVVDRPVAPPPAAIPAPAPAIAATPAPAAPQVVPVREKPSPLTPRRQEKPLIARNQEPPAAPAPVAPAPAEPGTAPAPPPPTAVQEPAAVPEPPPPPPPAAAPEQPEQRVPHTVTIAAGTVLPVRIGETISSARSQPGDSFLATLEQPLVVDGFIIAERGARLEGRVTDAQQAGHVKGASRLSISLVRLATSDGQNIRIRTEPYDQEGSNSSGKDAAKIGAGAAIGAVIGAIAGGGKGAAIGAGAGGAAGTGDVLLTHAKPAEIPVETRLSFRIQDPVTITERLD